MKLIISGFVLLTSAAISTAGELHPIVEVQTGYLFGASRDGKWIKADETAKSMAGETAFRVYGMTSTLGEAKSGKPKKEDEPCPETLSVELSPKPDKGVIAI